MTSTERHPFARDVTQAAIGALLAAAVAFGGGYAVGSITGFEALQLLEASLPTVRFLASAMMTATATILALMLTLLSLSYGTDFRMRDVHYRRVKVIARVDTIGFVVSTVFLLLLIIPLEETNQVAADWYDTIYYGVLATSAGIGGLLIAIVLMLYQTVRDVIDTFTGEELGRLAVEETPSEEDGGSD
jgi:hypothetical protein